MSYRVLLTPTAAKERDGLEHRARRRADRLLRSLVESPRPPGVRKLRGSRNDWRVRFGDFRVLYEIDDEARTVLVWRIAHRRDVYR